MCRNEEISVWGSLEEFGSSSSFPSAAATPRAAAGRSQPPVGTCRWRAPVRREAARGAVPGGSTEGSAGTREARRRRPHPSTAPLRGRAAPAPLPPGASAAGRHPPALRPASGLRSPAPCHPGRAHLARTGRAALATALTAAEAGNGPGGVL